MTVREIREVIGNSGSSFEIRRRLDRAGIKYMDKTRESGYFDIQIPNVNGYVKVYRSFRNEIKVIQMFSVIIERSGILIREPAGRRM